MRIAHLTDLHWTADPPLSRLVNKRMLGALSLYVRGRRHAFPQEVRRRLLDHVRTLDPDVLVITGDLTATALEAEFATAHDDLRPLLEQIPTLVLPGNHDVYTRGAVRARRMHGVFGRWMRLEDPWAPIARLDHEQVTVLGLDPCRPSPVSSGFVPPEQLARLSDALSDPALADRFVVLALHYPILDRHGAVYDGFEHGLRNARELIEVLRRAPRRPDAILHGHEHHGFTVPLDLDGHQVPIFNAGSSGYAFLPDKRRAASMNVYRVDGNALGGVDRYQDDGARFAPEVGGAYASGR